MPDTNPPQRERIVAGCMTGTSLDGLDAALVHITGTGLEMRAEYLGHVSLDMPPALRDTLMHLASEAAAEPLVYMRAARALGELHADGVRQLLDETAGPPPAFVVAHGQTIWHAPRDEGGPMSWQLFDPWPVVKRIGVPVCYDLRQADLIAGGEGAPLTPLADWVMYRGKADFVANLGGVFNYSSWPTGSESPKWIEGEDACLCNLLLDGFAMRLLQLPYDESGHTAASGQLEDGVYADLSMRFEALSMAGGSLGREYIQGGMIENFVDSHRGCSAKDLLLTVATCIAEEVANAAIGTESSRVVLAGGGTRNLALIQAIRTSVSPSGENDYVVLSDDLGIPCEAREAMGFAVLGALSQDGVPISLPQVTGAKDPGVAGVWAGTGNL